MGMKRNTEIRSISILGCGWLGLHLAKELVSNGYKVKGSTTSHSKLSDLRDFGIKPYLIDLNEKDNEEIIKDFLRSDALFVNIPPTKATTESQSYADSFYSIVNSISTSTIQNIVFISATSVYKSGAGKITEESELATSDRAIRLIEAEKLFLSLNKCTSVIRFGGLCGNGRNPVKYLSGKNDLEGGNKRTNMIHLVDCIRVSEKAIFGNISGVYNVVADCHPSKEAFYTAMGELFNVTPPLYIDSNKDLSGKWICSEKFKKDFSFEFKFPDPLNFPN